MLKPTERPTIPFVSKKKFAGWLAKEHGNFACVMLMKSQPRSI
jgi:hypothetical protein